MDVFQFDQSGQKAADAGKEYELLIAAQEAIRVLQGSAEAVAYQPVGLPGIDVHVQESQRSDYIQCKRRGGTSPGDWTWGRLRQESILVEAWRLLSVRPNCRYCFLSNRSASDFERAIEWSQGVCALPQVELEKVLAAKPPDLSTIRNDTKVDDSIGDQELVRVVATRICFRQTLDLKQLREALEQQAATILAGPKHDTLQHLVDLLDENQGALHDLAKLSALLETRGVLLLTPMGDPSAFARVRRVVDDYLADSAADQFAPTLRRVQNEDLLALCNDATQVICVHGDGGSGKSQVLAALVHDLHAARMPVLPLKLDQIQLEGGLATIGSAMSLGGTPSMALRAAAGRRRAFLVLDQLDTLRWASTQSGAAWRTVQDLITEGHD